MDKQNRKISSTRKLEIINPDAAGIDIGSKAHYVCVPEGRDSERIKSFGKTSTDGNVAQKGWALKLILLIHSM